MSWKKKIGIALAVVASSVVLLAGGAFILVHTEAFNRFVLAKIIEKGEAAIGTRIDIGRMEIHWDKLGVDVYDLAAYGTEGTSRPPLLRANHIGVRLKILSILKREINLSEIILDQPVVDLRVNAAGESNLPRSREPSKNNPVDTIFNLAIGHVLIRSGQIDYNDLQIPLSVDLGRFRSNIVFSILSGTYKGSLGYERGRIVARNFNPIEHGMQVNFNASRSELDMDPLTLTAGMSRVNAHVKLSNYLAPRITGNYEATVFTEKLAEILKLTSLPAGRMGISGSLGYENEAGEPFLDATYVDGRVESAQLRIRGGQVSADAKSVHGAFVLAKGDLHISDLEADLLRGHLKANGEILDLASKLNTRLTATLDGVSLEDVSSALPPGSYDRLHFSGTARVTGEANWAGSFQNIMAHSNVTIRSAPGASGTRAGSNTIPLSGMIDVRYDRARDMAAFGQSHLRTGATQISLSGTLSKRSNLAVQANTTDLHELSALVSEIRAATTPPSATTHPPQPFDIRGVARFTGQVSGSVKNPQIQGQLSASDLQAEGGKWRSLQVSFTASPSQIAAQNGILLSAQQGQINFSARAGLERWSLEPSNPIQGEARAANIEIADLERLAELHYPVAGILSANLTVQGTKQNPTGQGSLQIVKATAWEEPIDNFSMNFQGSGGKLESTAQLHIPAGEVTANVAFSPRDEEYQASVNAPGLKLNQIHAIEARNLGISGVLTLSASGSGTIRVPQASGRVQIAKMQIRGQSVSGAEAQLNVTRQHAKFALHSVIAQGNVEAKGDVALTDGYQTTASVDVRALPIGPLLASYMPGNGPSLQGQTEIHADLNGPLKEPARIQAHVEVPTFNLAYGFANISLVRPLRLDYQAGVATLQQTELKGTDTDLTIKGVIPVKNTSSAFNIAANGTLDLSLVQSMTKGVKSSGRVELAFTGSGNLKNPQMQGHLQIQNAYLSSDSIPVGIEGVNGLLKVSGNRIEVSELTGNVGGGTISAQGSIVYGTQSTFHLGLQGNSVRVRYPEGLRSILNCNLQLNGSTASSTLSGRVVVDRLSFTNQFDLANFMGQLTGPSVATTPSALEQNMKLNIALQSAADLNLVSSQLSMQGAANLNIVGTMANPVMLGRMTLTGGDIFFLGKRYEVRNGTIEFSNPVHTEPVLNLYVKTTVDQYDITLNFIGPVDQLKTNYTADPPLPPADIINLLALGQTAEEAATSNTPASLGAESALASGVASQVSGKIQRLAGISQLTIDPMAGNNQANPGAQVAIQQRVSGNILLTFSTDVSSTQATTVQLQYRTSRQTSVTVLRDQNGGYAIDFRLRKTF